MDVTFRVDGRSTSQNATAVMRNDGIVGGKSLALVFENTCTGDDCAPTGYRFQSKSLGW